MAVVDVIKARYSKDLHMMYLIYLLIFLASTYNFWFTTVHIPGKLNIATDSLSNMCMLLTTLHI